MKYLLNWIKKELNPDKYTPSQTTDSHYFSINGAKIRVSNHFGRDECDLQIFIVKDLLGKNKHYMVKEKEFPSFVSVPDVKTLKIVICTFLFHYKNIQDTKAVKELRELVGNPMPVPNDPEETKTITLDDVIQKADNSEASMNLVLSCIEKFKVGDDGTQDERTAFGSYVASVFPMWSNLTSQLKKYTRYIFRSGKTLEQYIQILKIEFPDDNSWQKKTAEEILKSILQYVPEELHPNVPEVLNVNSDSVIAGITHALSPDANIVVCTKPKDYICNLKTLEDFYVKGIQKLSDSKKQSLYNVFGNLMAQDTGNKFSKTTDGQKKSIRDMMQKNIPYNYISEFFNRTMTPSIKNSNKLAPTTDVLKGYINRFLKLYNIGIIKYPNEPDFMTCKLTKTDNDTISDDIDIQVKESVTSNSVTPCTEKPTHIYIQSVYDYSDPEYVKIKDVSNIFSENHINIIRTVIDNINVNQSANSFDNKRVLDVFAEHYTDIWDKLTNTQKDLCGELITVENMNLSEADYVINKVFNKDTFSWPVTEVCRKYISEYCRRIREMRIAA